MRSIIQQICDIVDDNLISKMEFYNSAGEYVPLLALIKISSECNARCVMCKNWKTEKHDIDMPILDRAIDDLSELKCEEIRLTGGEPTINENFIDVVRKVASKNISFSLITNGGGNHANLKKSADIGLKKVYFSIDSHDSNIHDRLRGLPGLFKSAMGSIGILKSYPTTKRIMNTVISRHNVLDIQKIAQLAVDEEFHGFNPIPIKGHTDSFLTADEIIKYNNEILPEVTDILSTGNVIFYGGTGNVFGKSKTDIEESSNGIYTGSYYKMHKCVVSSYSAFITNHGIVFPCSNTPYMGNEFILGNLNYSSFQNIWNSGNASNVRDMVNGRTTNCIGCDFTNLRANNYFGEN